MRDDEAVIREMKKILTFEPKNHQAQNLMKASEKRLQRDGLIGIGVAGGIAAVGAAVIGTLGIVIFLNWNLLKSNNYPI